MKKLFVVASVVMAMALIVLIGCTSPSAKAQKLYDEGKYEEVIAQYGSDPNMAAIVTQAKEKHAEKLVAEGQYAVVIEKYPETAAAKAAQEKLAEQLFLAKNYAEVIAKYPTTTWAAMAKAEMDKAAAGVEGASGGKTAPAPGSKPGGVDNAKEQAAKAEFDRIMAIKIKDVRTKALNEFVADPRFAGTKAVADAHKALGH